ncbi:hypothetical protein WMY93_029769 [Mugilogobius chulae]|uniref:Disease resistance R13L4/SHOC-2-like LRR domain-containing protein n=1 Tax=Mugilogobius chulae TaxID=88201 RepID=A0AAW0MPH3_9GOBI
MNRLSTLPRGFGSLPALEVLDLTYNNLNHSSLPGNFFYLTTLRALYLSDNDFEMLPADIGKLSKLQILSLRDNDLISLPKEIGDLVQLKELHIQGNRLTVLPPELGNLDLTGPKQVFKAENNPWVTPIADQFQLGVSHVFEYVRSETYNTEHCRSSRVVLKRLVSEDGGEPNEIQSGEIPDINVPKSCSGARPGTNPWWLRREHTSGLCIRPHTEDTLYSLPLSYTNTHTQPLSAQHCSLQKTRFTLCLCLRPTHTHNLCQQGLQLTALGKASAAPGRETDWTGTCFQLLL